MNKIIQITDLHLTKPGTRLWGIDPCNRLEACLNDLAQHHADADFCVISGDLTEAGDPEALRYLQKKLDNFPIDTHLMIGNHDNRERFLSTFPNQPTDGNGFIQYAIQTSFGRFIFLDTKKDEPTSAGHLCRQRIDWLADELEQYIGDVFIFMHHPPCDVGVAYMDRIKLDNHEIFAETLSQNMNIRHIFFGHVHRPVFLTWRGISCSACPGLNHQVPLVAGSVQTNYSIEPPMYAIIEISQKDIRVNLDSFLDRESIDA